MTCPGLRCGVGDDGSEHKGGRKATNIKEALSHTVYLKYIFILPLGGVKLRKRRQVFFKKKYIYILYILPVITKGEKAGLLAGYL